MTRPLAAALALGAVAAVALWLLLPGDEAPRPGAGDAARSDFGPAAGGNREAGGDADAGSDPGAGIQPAADEDAARARSAEVAPPTVEETHASWTIRVLDADGAPVTGAEVFVLDDAEAPVPRRDSHRLRGAPQLPDILLRDGRARRTDARGEVTVPEQSFPYAHARLEGHCATRDLFREAGQERPFVFEMQLHPRLPFTVRVVDADGAPVPHAPVRFEQSFGSFRSAILQQQCDASGVLAIHDLTRWWQRAADAEFACAVDVLAPEDRLPDSHRVPLDAEVLKAGTCTLIAPAAGSVAVRVVGPDGEAFHHGGRIHLSLAGRVGLSALGSRPYALSELEGGRTHFPQVGLGLRLYALLPAPSGRAFDAITFDGPTRASEAVDVVLRRKARPALTATLLDPDGEALAHARISLRVEALADSEALAWESGTSTDETGTLWIEPLPDDAQPGASELRLRWLQRRGRQPDRAATQTLAGPLPDATTDLGTIRMTDLPLLVDCRVVDAHGAPVSGGNLSLQIAPLGTQEWRPLDPGRSFGLGSDAHFVEHREALPGQAYRIHVRSQEHGTATRVFEPGTEGLVVQFDAPTIVAGTILVDPEFDLSEFHVKFSSSGDRTRTTRIGAGDEPGTGQFRQRIDPDQTHTIEVISPLYDALHTIDALRVPAGQETTPPSLDPLDLRGRLRRFTLSVVGTDGRVPEGRLRVVVPRASGRTSYEYGHHGTVTLIAEGPVDRLWVGAPGHAPVELTGVDGDRDVVLGRAVDCTLALPETIRMPDDLELAYSVDASTDAHQACLGYSGIQAFGSAGAVHVRLPGTGEFRVNLLLTDVATGQKRAWLAQFLRFQVAAEGERIVLPITDEEFATAVSKIRNPE